MMTTNADYSSVVPAGDQAGSNGGAVGALNDFLVGLGALVKPVAQVVAAVQAPKNTMTTDTRDGLKAATPVSSTPTVAAGGMDSKTIMIAGAVLGGVVAVILIARK